MIGSFSNSVNLSTNDGFESLKIDEENSNYPVDKEAQSSK